MKSLKKLVKETEATKPAQPAKPATGTKPASVAKPIVQKASMRSPSGRTVSIQKNKVPEKSKKGYDLLGYKSKDSATTSSKEYPSGTKNTKKTSKPIEIKEMKTFKQLIRESDKDQKVEAYGTKGMKNERWRKIFKNVEEMNKWMEKNDATFGGMRYVDSKETLNKKDLIK